MAKVTGVGAVVKRLATAKNDCAKGMERGLVKAALLVQRESQKIVPVDTGALKNSAFTRKVGSGFSTDAIVGYTQNYAIFVHENLEAKHAPGKTAQFLLKPMLALRSQLIAIIRKEAKVK